MVKMAIDNPFENDGEFGFDRKKVVENHGRDAMVHLKVGQCDIPEALEVILDHHADFEVWLNRNNRQAFAVEDATVGLYHLEERTPMEGTGCVVISKPKN